MSDLPLYVRTDHTPKQDCRVPEGETTAMHLVLKSADAKTPDAPSAGNDKTPDPRVSTECNCVIC